MKTCLLSWIFVSFGFSSFLRVFSYLLPNKCLQPSFPCGLAIAPATWLGHLPASTLPICLQPPLPSSALPGARLLSTLLLSSFLDKLGVLSFFPRA